jgi:chitinase
MWLPLSLVAAKFVAIILLLVTAGTSTALPDSLNSWLAAHPVGTQVATTPIKTSNRTLSYAQLQSQLSACPVSCDVAGFTPSNWTRYHALSRLGLCDQTMLLDFTIYNPLDDPTSQVSIGSCSANFAVGTSNTSSPTNGLCPSRGKKTQVQESLQIAFSGTGGSGSLDDFVAASQQLEAYLSQRESGCNSTIAFAYSNSAAVGIFAGSGVQDITTSVLQQFITKVQSVGISESVLVQLCAGQNRSSRYGLGIVANANADLASTQKAVQTWASGNCVTSYDHSETWQNITLSVPSIVPSANATASNGTSPTTHAFAPRATCNYEQVASGDTCRCS